MKKIKFLILNFILIFALSGCGNAIPELTEEQRSQIVEYSAMLLLKYDKNYSSNVLDESEIEKQEKKLEEDAELKKYVQEQKELAQQNSGNSSQGNEGGSEDVPPVVEASVYTDIDEFLGLSGLDISYSSYSVSETYPENLDENSWQGVCRATGTNKLVVLYFDITNVSGSDYYLDIASMDTRFTFKVNGNLSKYSLTTLLTDDFNQYRDTIAAGETKTAVLIMEVSSDVANSLNSAVMKMKNGDAYADTTLF